VNDHDASPAPPDRPQLGLSPEQLRAVECLAARGKGESLEDVAERAGCCRETLWRWRKLPEFKSALRERTRELVGEDLPAVYQALIRKAKGGDVKAIELVLKVTGELDEARREDQMRGYVHLIGLAASPELQEIVYRLVRSGVMSGSGEGVSHRDRLLASTGGGPDTMSDDGNGTDPLAV
jgi:transposase-like protein